MSSYFLIYIFFLIKTLISTKKYKANLKEDTHAFKEIYTYIHIHPMGDSIHHRSHRLTNRKHNVSYAISSLNFLIREFPEPTEDIVISLGFPTVLDFKEL